MGSHTTEAEARRALESFRRIVQALRESSRAAERTYGLTGAQLFVLQRLAAAGSASINELAELTLTHQSSVSVVVSRLSEAKLVRREKARDDARRVVVSLTPRGRRLADKSPDAAQMKLLEALRALPPRRLRELAVALDATCSEMGLDARKPSSMFFEEKQP